MLPSASVCSRTKVTIDSSVVNNAWAITSPDSSNATPAVSGRWVFLMLHARSIPTKRISAFRDRRAGVVDGEGENLAGPCVLGGDLAHRGGNLHRLCRLREGEDARPGTAKAG